MTSAEQSTVKRLITLLLTAAKKWSFDRVPRLGAALAYYTVFAVAPLIVVAVSVSGLVLSEQAARGEIVDRIEDTVGAESAAFIQDLIENASGGGAVGGAVVGFVLALFGASALAVQLERSLNEVWDVPYEETKGIGIAIKTRLVGIVTIAAIGVFLIAMLIAQSMVATIDTFLSDELSWLDPVLQVANPVVSLALTAVAFSLMFRFLPEADVEWESAFVGGAVAAVLFTVGSWVLSRYLGSGSVAAGFGAASALIVLLVFVYYSAQIVLFGAEVGRVHGMLRRGEPLPEPIAPKTAVSTVPVDEPVRPQSVVGAAGRRTGGTSMSAVWAFVVGLALGRLGRRSR